MPGTRDRSYSEYLVRKNSWLQLQQVRLSPRHPLCTDSDQLPSRFGSPLERDSVPTVNNDLLARDIRCCVGCKKDRRANEVARLAPTS
jgi:hypothetical protein